MGNGSEIKGEVSVNPADLKEARIIFQNALAHSTNISIHNASITQREVTKDEVIKLAKLIAKEVFELGK